MFRILEAYEHDLTFAEAADAMTRHGRGDMLEGLKAMDRVWEEYLAEDRAYAEGKIDEKMFGDDEDFYAHYGYECTAYNVVYENMAKLFERA